MPDEHGLRVERRLRHGDDASGSGATDLPDGFCRIDSSSNHLCTVGCTNMNDCPCTDITCTLHYACSGGVCALN